MGEKSPRLTFYPFAYALFTEELCSYCWYCLNPVETIKRCLGCGMALFCNKNCQTLGWKDHRAECKGLRKSTTLPNIETRILGRIVLRHKDICSGRDKKDPHFYKDRTSQRTILQIWAHTDKIRQDKYAMNKFEDVYQNLKLFYDEKFMLSKEMVFELHCRDFINRHAISDKAYIKEIGKGLYLDLCAYDHSCRPNTIYNCQGFVATLIALNGSVNISNRNSTFYSYIELLCSQLQRKKLLKDTWYFDCQCERCVDPEDHMLTSMLCPNCPQDNRARLCIFGDHDYKDKISHIIVCPQCKNEVPQDYTLEAVDAMRFIDRIFEDKEVEQMPKKSQIEFLEDLLERFEKILPPINVFLCKIIQNIIPMIAPSKHADLLKLHMLAEECVRYCFPKNHPAVAFHLRNIGIFLNNLGRVEDAVKYFKEAEKIMVYILGVDHTMAVENRVLLDQALLNLQETREVKESIEETSLHNKTEEILLEDKRHSITGDSDEIQQEVTDIKGMSRRFPLREIEADDEFVILDGNEQLVPDGSKDVEVIGQMNYIRMFLSGKLLFPPDNREHLFGYEDLKEIETLGNGSFGTVKKMKHIGTGMEMAVKRVRIISNGLDDFGINRSLKRLQLEVAAIKSASNCEQIVQFYGITFHEGDGLVCMELMDISLENLYLAVHRFGYPSFDESTLASIAISTIKALNHMKNQHHIIHRDVKPSNILLNLNGQVKLCDFGICGYLQDSVAQTRDAGCRPYMAPERLNASSKGYDIRSDVWSLGISMVEVANFAFPYPGFSSAPVFAQLHLVVHGDAPMVSNPLYSTRTKNFIHWCVTKDFNHRPTFADLTKTPYYEHYNSMSNLNYLVGTYVSDILLKIENHKQRCNQ